MIDAAQIRAARAMLDWPTTELAKRSGLTVNGINKIERGHVNAQRDSLKKLQLVFEQAGIEFLPESGVQRKDDIITTYEGKDFAKKLLSDVYATLRKTGGEYLAAHMDEQKEIEDMGLSFIKDQLNKRNRLGVGHRMLVQKNDSALIPPYSMYHVLAEDYFSLYPLYIYGTKLGLSSRKYAPKSVIIDNVRAADAARKLFDFIWDHTEPVPHSQKSSRKTKKKSRKLHD